jgi:outer membrane protein
MKFIRIVAALFVAIGMAASSGAEEQPLWEAGLGIGAIAFPDYRGSDEMRIYPVPVPYFVYRGEFLKADRDGLRGELFDRDYVELSLSLNATIPVNSDDNAARRGMPDLRSTLEIGPSLDIHLWRSQDGLVRFDAILPLRAPITVESAPRSIGWVFAPRLNVDRANVANSGWNVGFGLGPVYADRRYHDYFYAVRPRYATTERPEYRAPGGFSGWHVLASLTKRYPTYWVGAYVRYDALGDAVFADSPLVTSRSSIAGGFGIAWMIGQSKRLVAVD